MRFGLPSMAPPLGSAYPSSMVERGGLPGSPGFQAEGKINRSLGQMSTSPTREAFAQMTGYRPRIWQGGV